jgi:flavin-dependent dehydrogenase
MLAPTWDVIVVGSGPAGSAVALTQPPGQRVLIVDRRRAPWRKPCDGILTPMSRRVLKTLGVDCVENWSAQTTDRLSVVDRDRHETFSLPLTDHVMVDRQAFDTGLRACFAARPDITFLDHAHVQGWVARGDHMAVRLCRNGEPQTLAGRIVVDATGAAGVSRHSPGDPPPTAVAVQLWYPSQGDAARCDWIFDARTTPYYMWAIHKPAGLLLGGVFPHSEARGARRAMTGLAASLAVRGSPWRVQCAGMGMPRSRSHIRVVAHGALVVGEAANLVNAATGEGISFALRSGLLCGRAVAGAPRRADATRLYAEAVAPLCEEAFIKARHACDLFDRARRRAIPADHVLVPVPRLSLELPA